MEDRLPLRSGAASWRALTIDQIALAAGQIVITGGSRAQADHKAVANEASAPFAI